jgi:hypothetical protein
MTKSQGDHLRSKQITHFALALLATSAHADWVKMGETDEGSLYIDPLTIQRDGNVRQVWELMDLKQRDEGGELSRRLKVQYNCALRQTQVLSISTHWEPTAAGGTLLSVARAGLWKEVPRGTAYETGFNRACGQ